MSRLPAVSRVRAQVAQGATFVELFFDLVFVYAVTQLTAFLAHDLTWGGLAKTGLLFWLVWWAWTQFTWTLNLADTEHSLVRVPTLMATAVAFFMAQAVPDAFGDAGVWFAVSYVVVRMIGLALQVWVIGSDQRMSVTVWSVASQTGLVLVIIGGFADPDLRVWWWAGAFAADVLAGVLAGRGEWVLDPAHFAERHGLIVIIALGESLIAAGVASSEAIRDFGFAVTVGSAVIATCALWWTYFGTLHSRLEEAMQERVGEGLGLFARDVFSYWHALVVAGVIGIAVAFEEAIAHPEESLSIGASLSLTVGIALFAGGLAGAAARAGVRSAVLPRLGVAAVAIAVTPMVAASQAWVALLGLAGLIVVIDVFDASRAVLDG